MKLHLINFRIKTVKPIGAVFLRYKDLLFIIFGMSSDNLLILQ